MENLDSVYMWLLMAAGLIGAAIAIVHGLLMQRLMVRPILEQAKVTPATERLFPILLQFSTFCWFFGGLALMAAPLMPSKASIVTTAIFVGSFYVFGAVGNFVGTKGRHPGWVLLAISSVLIVIGLVGISA